MKKYIISVDVGSDGKAGILAEVKEDGTVLVLADKYESTEDKKPKSKKRMEDQKVHSQTYYKKNKDRVTEHHRKTYEENKERT